MIQLSKIGLTPTLERALKAAQKRMENATKERAKAQDKLAELNLEIPNLQRTIAALQSQLNPQATRNIDVHSEGAAIDPELASYVGPQDLTGFGSIPAIPENTLVEMVEENFLPPITGKPLVEE